MQHNTDGYCEYDQRTGQCNNVGETPTPTPPTPTPPSDCPSYDGNKVACEGNGCVWTPRGRTCDDTFNCPAYDGLPSACSAKSACVYRQGSGKCENIDSPPPPITPTPTTPTPPPVDDLYCLSQLTPSACNNAPAADCFWIGAGRPDPQCLRDCEAIGNRANCVSQGTECRWESTLGCKVNYCGRFTNRNVCNNQAVGCRFNVENRCIPNCNGLPRASCDLAYTDCRWNAGSGTCVIDF